MVIRNIKKEFLCFPIQTCLRGTNSARAPSRWLTWSGRRWENQRHWQTVDQNTPSVAGSGERDSPSVPVPWQKPRSPFPAKSRRRLQLWTHARAQGAQLADKRRGDNLLSQRLLFYHVVCFSWPPSLCNYIRSIHMTIYSTGKENRSSQCLSYKEQ